MVFSQVPKRGMSYNNTLRGAYNQSSDTTEVDSLSIGRFKITPNGVFVGTKQVIDRNGNLIALNALSNQIANITTNGMFTGVRQTAPNATLDIAGTGNFLGNVTCASTISASFLQGNAGSISSLSCSTISAGTYLGITPTFVGSGSSLVLNNATGTHLTLINPTGGGTNSFASIDFAGYGTPQYTNGAPISLRFMDDGAYGGILSIRSKTDGAAANNQTELVNIGAGGVAFTGSSRFATRVFNAGMQIVGQSYQYPNTNPFAGGSISLLITPPTQAPGANIYLGCFTGNYTVGSTSQAEIVLARQVISGTMAQPYIQMSPSYPSFTGPALFMNGYGSNLNASVNAFFNVDTYQNIFNCSLPTTFSGNTTFTGGSNNFTGGPVTMYQGTTFSNTSGTNMLIVNPNGNGVYCGIDIAGYQGWSNGAPLTLRWNDNNYSGNLSYRFKTPGAAANSQFEVLNVNPTGANVTGTLTGNRVFMQNVTGTTLTVLGGGSLTGYFNFPQNNSSSSGIT